MREKCEKCGKTSRKKTVLFEETIDENEKLDKNWHDKHIETIGFGGRIADSVAKGMGSWTFIIAQTGLVVIWMALNLVGFMYHWDVYPFILLNLLFSTQAAYAAPIIMMSQNRQSDKDRTHAEEDYKTNVDAKLEIETLLLKISSMEINKIDKIIVMMEEMKNKKPSKINK